MSARASKYGLGSGRYELYFNVPESKENKKLLDMVRKDKSKGFDMVEFEVQQIVHFSFPSRHTGDFCIHLVQNLYRIWKYFVD